MGITGPKPVPTAMKELQGNPGQRPLNNDTIHVNPAKDLRPPIRLIGEASREWVRITPHLHKLGLLTDLDLTILAAYCDAWGRYVEATALVRAEGVLVMGYRGSLVKNPAAQIAKDALADVLRIGTEFGMTPSSRGRIHIPGSDEPDDDLDGIFS